MLRRPGRNGRRVLGNSAPKGLCPGGCLFGKLYAGFNLQPGRAGKILNINPQEAAAGAWPPCPLCAGLAPPIRRLRALSSVGPQV